MRATSFVRLAAVASTAALFAACGGGDNDPVPVVTQQGVGEYLQGLPTWVQFSPPQDPESTKLGTETKPERLDFPVKDSQGHVIGVRSEQYSCTTTKYDMKSTPEKIVMFSPDREVLWPGALIQGASHKAAAGSLLPLTIRERSPIKVSIPSLATAGNFRTVDSPDQASVNDAIGAMVGAATANDLVAPSSIQFTLRDYSNEKSFALKAGLSGKYMGFSASASANVSTNANEHTVMVYFVEKMFEVVVEPPQTPGAFFSAEFTREKLDQQVAMGRLGPNNLPVYVSNIVYGRMMAFTFTSTASSTDVAAALNAAYKGIAEVNFDLEQKYKDILNEGKIAITSIGGPSTATVAMIASGNWRDYFKPDQPAPLTSAYPISYTLRNLGDGSIAKVRESADYEIRECTPMNTAGFMLDSFETAANWPHDNPVGATRPLSVVLGDAASPQSIFYGYEIARHLNWVDNSFFKYDVGYIKSPHFAGDMSQYYRGEFSFWFKPDENMYTFGSARQHCYWTVVWVLFIPVPVYECVWLPNPLNDVEPLSVTVHSVLAYDDYTTADQVVLRGGGVNDFEVLTLTYNPPSGNKVIPLEWQKRTISLSNDDVAGKTLCVNEPHAPSGKTLLRGCWLVEDRAATEYEIQYVLNKVTELKLRASYPVLAVVKVCSVNPEPPTGCPSYVDSTAPIPLGYVGGYFDEIKITKPLVSF